MVSRSRLVLRSSLAGLLTLFLLGHVAQATSTDYTLVPLEGGRLLALDRTDEITLVGEALIDGKYQAIRVRRDQPVEIIGLLPGGTFSQAAKALAGKVVGQSSTGNFGLLTHAFLFQNGLFTDLGTTGAAYLFSAATCLSDTGDIFGYGDFPSGASFAPLRWPVGEGAQVLGTLDGGQGVVTTCNRAGVAGGDSRVASGETHATLWLPPSYGVVDIQTIPSPFARVQGLSERVDPLEAVGTLDTMAGPLGFTWTLATGMVALTPLPGDTQSSAADVNDAGTRVGYSARPDPDNPREVIRTAVLWGSDGVPVDLHTRVTATEWVLMEAFAIGPNGVIAVRGTFQGQPANALLVPQRQGKHDKPPKDKRHTKRHERDWRYAGRER